MLFSLVVVGYTKCSKYVSVHVGNANNGLSSLWNVKDVNNHDLTNKDFDVNDVVDKITYRNANYASKRHKYITPVSVLITRLVEKQMNEQAEELLLYADLSLPYNFVSLKYYMMNLHSTATSSSVFMTQLLKSDLVNQENIISALMSRGWHSDCIDYNKVYLKSKMTPFLYYLSHSELDMEILTKLVAIVDFNNFSKNLKRFWQSYFDNIHFKSIESFLLLKNQNIPIPSNLNICDINSNSEILENVPELLLYDTYPLQNCHLPFIPRQFYLFKPIKFLRLFYRKLLKNTPSRSSNIPDLFTHLLDRILSHPSTTKIQKLRFLSNPSWNKQTPTLYALNNQHTDLYYALVKNEYLLLRYYREWLSKIEVNNQNSAIALNYDVIEAILFKISNTVLELEALQHKSGQQNA